MRRIHVTWLLISIFFIMLIVTGGITFAAYGDPTANNQMTISDIANNIDIINGSTNTPPADYVPGAGGAFRKYARDADGGISGFSKWRLEEGIAD